MAVSQPVLRCLTPADITLDIEGGTVPTIQRGGLINGRDTGIRLSYDVNSLSQSDLTFGVPNSSYKTWRLGRMSLSWAFTAAPTSLQFPGPILDNQPLPSSILSPVATATGQVVLFGNVDAGAQVGQPLGADLLRTTPIYNALEQIIYVTTPAGVTGSVFLG